MVSDQKSCGIQNKEVERIEDVEYVLGLLSQNAVVCEGEQHSEEGEGKQPHSAEYVYGNQQEGECQHFVQIGSVPGCQIIHVRYLDLMT